MSKRELKDKVAAAERGCTKAHAAWSAASDALARSVSVNGYGIFHDTPSLRANLEEAQRHIAVALAALESTEWPTKSDYDQL